MKIKVRILPLIMLLAFLSSIVTGCGDAQEIDDEVYVLAIGIDKGTTNKVRVTIQYATYSTGGGGGGTASGGKKEDSQSNQIPGSIIHTIEAPTILEAIDMYGMAISRRVSLMHTKQLIFSEEFAKEGVGDYIAPMARFRETRRIMNVTVVKGSAQDFIKENKTNIGESAAKSMELMAVQSRNTSFFPLSNFQTFYTGMLSTYEQAYSSYAGINEFKNLESESEKKAPLIIDKGYLPGELPREGVAKREFVGTALFDGDKMVGTLNSVETRYFLMVKGIFRKGIITLEDKNAPGQAIPIDMRIGRPPRIKARFVDDKPVIDVNLVLEGDIGAIQSRISYEKVKYLNELNREAEKHLEEGIIKVIKKTQEYNSDIFGFGHKIAGSFDIIQDWEKYNWKKHYKEAEVNVHVSVNIRRTGLIIHSSPIIGSESK